MRVNGSGPNSADRAQESGKAGEAGSSRKSRSRHTEDSGSDGGDKVAISGRAKDIARAREAANSAPDVDEAKVAKFRAAIQSGSYQVDADKVADRMVDEHLHTLF